MKAHVDTVVTAIHIGDDLSLEEVQNLIKEYADCFALSMSEVHHIPGAVHKINILKDKVFNMKHPCQIPHNKMNKQKGSSNPS